MTIRGKGSGECMMTGIGLGGNALVSGRRRSRKGIFNNERDMRREEIRIP